MPPSSRGLGHLPFTEVTGIRIPLGVLKKFKNKPKDYFGVEQANYPNTVDVWDSLPAL